MEAKDETEIFGVKVDNLRKDEVLEKIENFLREDKFHQIATINPEFILEAKKDKEFKSILNNCDLNIADGCGLKFAFWRRGQKLRARIAGVDLMRDILKIANDKNFKVFLVANNRGLSRWKEVRSGILKIYPKLDIEGADLDYKNSNFKLQITNYDVIFCNFGAPHQEKFLNSLKYAKIRLAMGVGGSFDFATGKLRRAPLWMRKIGLEWLFRFIQQPSRFRRIFNAVIIFPIKILFSKKANE